MGFRDRALLDFNAVPLKGSSIGGISVVFWGVQGLLASGLWGVVGCRTSWAQGFLEFMGIGICAFRASSWRIVA